MTQQISPSSIQIYADSETDPEKPYDLMEKVEQGEHYLRSIDELLVPVGMKRNDILKEKEIHVVQLECVVETLLQNFLVSISPTTIQKLRRYPYIFRTNQMTRPVLAWIWPGNSSEVAQS